MMRGFGDLKQGNGRAARPEEIVDMLELGRDFTQVRFVGPLCGYAQRWINIDTKNKGVIGIPKVALNYDPDTDTFDDTIEDPYKDIPNEQRMGRVYFINAIIRDLQDDKPRRVSEPERSERRSGFKDRRSKTWTPVQVVRIPGGFATQIAALKQMNKHRVKGKTQEFEFNDPEYGCDLFLSYDESRKPNAYNVQKGDHTPLTREERGYLLWDISNLMQKESLEQARREAQALASKNPVDEDIEDDEDDALDRRRGRGDRDDRSIRSSSSGDSRDRDRSSRSERTGREERTSRTGRSPRDDRDSGRTSRSSSGREDRTERGSRDRDRGSDRAERGRDRDSSRSSRSSGDSRDRDRGTRRRRVL